MFLDILIHDESLKVFAVDHLDMYFRPKSGDVHITRTSGNGVGL